MMTMDRSTPPSGRRRRLPRAASALLVPFTAVSTACGLFGGGGDPETPAPAPAPAQQQDVLGPVSADSRLYADNAGGFVESERLVIRDEGEWSTAWERATSHQAAPPSRPAVDFSAHMVVLVAAGRMTPEDQIRVDSVGVRSVRNEAGALEEVFEIVVRTTEGCGRLRVDAYPFEIVRTRRFEGPVRFVERQAMVEGCGAP